MKIAALAASAALSPVAWAAPPPSAARPRGQQLARRDFEKRRLRALAPFEFNQPRKRGVGEGESELE